MPALTHRVCRGVFLEAVVEFLQLNLQQIQLFLGCAEVPALAGLLEVVGQFPCFLRAEDAGVALLNGTGFL
ncbi:MAG: hypothetical protein CMO80_13710 [Verrucomicrobiales bacterium]|nr:hypothetical protein [Verrucomicrobiales bacterium]